MSNRALVIVDVQNDFCPGGALPVAGGDQVVPVLNKYLNDFLAKGYPVFATRDWHPHRTTHFKDFGGLWPVHCVQNTFGAAFHPQLALDQRVMIISKGMDAEKDSYSGFQGMAPCGRPFLDILRAQECQALFVGGLATDYCVKATVLDALQQGFEVYLLQDAIQGVDVDPQDSKQAIRTMSERGARLMTYQETQILLNKVP